MAESESREKGGKEIMNDVFELSFEEQMLLFSALNSKIKEIDEYIAVRKNLIKVGSAKPEDKFLMAAEIDKANCLKLIDKLGF